jgi:hypothetical protein
MKESEHLTRTKISSDKGHTSTMTVMAQVEKAAIISPQRSVAARLVGGKWSGDSDFD